MQLWGRLVEVPLDWRMDPTRPADYQVLPDIKPYKSMINGQEIGSRSTHREHLRAHQCIEVGNEVKHLMRDVKPLQSPPGLKDALIRNFEKVKRR